MPHTRKLKWAASNSKPVLPAMFDPFTGINCSTGIRYIVKDDYRLRMARGGHYAYADYFLIPMYFGDGWSASEINFRGDNGNFVTRKAVEARNRLTPILVAEGYSQEDAENALSIALDANDPRMDFYHDLLREVQRIEAENNKLTDGRAPSPEDE